MRHKQISIEKKKKPKKDPLFAPSAQVQPLVLLELLCQHLQRVHGRRPLGRPGGEVDEGGAEGGDAGVGVQLEEAVLVAGQASQTTTLRWEDYTQTAVDPVDDCTFWYVGDYYRAGAPSYSTRIGAFRMPDCPER